MFKTGSFHLGVHLLLKIIFVAFSLALVACSGACLLRALPVDACCHCGIVAVIGLPVAACHINYKCAARIAVVELNVYRTVVAGSQLRVPQNGTTVLLFVGGGLCLAVVGRVELFALAVALQAGVACGAVCVGKVGYYALVLLPLFIWYKASNVVGVFWVGLLQCV